ncbi:SPFH domain-containing protein [Haploplasma modicum]|uniref:SPFH domain-containing protein n=1 Tax=Haploplasma modicum TaxID=2150 RepID=UPI00138AAE39|nr:SPFH domain-containing protein [Haploplasma modicum]
MSLLNVIEYKGNNSNNWVIYEHPNKEFNNQSKIITSVGQVSIIVHGGIVEKILDSGTHIVENLNLPFLSGIQKNVHGNTAPFPMQVFFINKTIKLDMLWGTLDPIMLLEPKFNVKVNVRARGQFGIRIRNYQFLLTQLIGSFKADVITFERINDFFRGVLNTRVKTILSSEIIKNKISILDINMYLNDLSKNSLEILKPEFEHYGFELINFYYSSINLPDADLETINKILNKNAEFDILGSDRYKASRGYDVLEKAAENEGSGNFASVGLGLGLGKSFADDVLNVKDDMKIEETKCGGCNHQIKKDDVFCPNCGKKQIIKCKKCQNELNPGAKFCSMCGNAVEGGSNL